jgi:hypothetical protein
MLARFSRDSTSFPREAIIFFVRSHKRRAVKPVRACFSQASTSFSLKALCVFFTQGDTSPFPEAELGLVSRCSSRPRGSSFYGGFDAPSGTSSDDGLGTWRPILQKLGPLPAQMGGMQLATWIHLTSRNLSCFHWARFSQSRLLRESAPRRRTPHLPGGCCRYPASTSELPSTGPPSIPSDFSCVPNMCFYLKMFRSHIVASIRSCRG